MQLDIKITKDVRYCSDCSQGYLGSEGVFCKMYSMLVWDERDATICESYDCPDRTPVILLGRKKF